ncbi:MAG: hypothetical protein WB511_00235 [Nitrososphaeraceae archaeon]
MSDNYFNLNQEGIKYSYPCPWCHTRISSFDNELSKGFDNLLMCPECEEFFHIDYSTEPVHTTKIDTLLSFQA